MAPFRLAALVVPQTDSSFFMTFKLLGIKGERAREDCIQGNLVVMWRAGRAACRFIRKRRYGLGKWGPDAGSRETKSTQSW